MPSDVEARAFVAERLGGDIRGFSPIGHGEWSRAFTFDHADGEYVARFSAFESDFAKDRVAAGFASAALPIPAIVDMGRAFDGFFAVSRRASGGFLDALDRPQLEAVLPALFGALDAARRVDLSAAVGYGPWAPNQAAPHPTWRTALLDIANDWPDGRTHGWRNALANSPTGSGPFDEAFKRLQALVDVCPEERHLVHADLLNYNVLVAGQALSAVIDWGCSLYGDFLYDIAWLAFWAPWYPAWAGVDFVDEAARHYAAIGLEVPYLEARIRCYEVHIGLDSQAYNAYKGDVRWANLETVARRTLAIASGAAQSR
jgi:hygromycin-B 4-O-kinase